MYTLYCICQVVYYVDLFLVPWESTNVNETKAVKAKHTLVQFKSCLSKALKKIWKSGCLWSTNHTIRYNLNFRKVRATSWLMDRSVSQSARPHLVRL